MSLKLNDPEVYSAIEDEIHRQKNNLELIASENFVSKEVLEAQGSVFTNKYAEGYPSKRYYGGCVNADRVEQLAIDRLKELFQAKFANVQPHSGSSANMAAYRVLLKPNDVVLGLALDQGGHLTHGHPLNFSGIDYEFHPYYVDKDTEKIDYEALEQLAHQYKPALIVAGASSYSIKIDFERISKIAKSVQAYFMVDMAHIAGIIAAGLHQNPVLYADVVTSTTHKTLRGPRGGVILTNNPDLAKKIDRTVFPGIQGGPLMHIIAAKAVAFKEALSDSFIDYQKQVVKNARALAKALQALGYVVVAGGTDNHMFSVNVKKSVGITGKLAEEWLDEVGITVNKNTIPYDDEKPMVTSGIRIGTPSLTSRGMKEEEMLIVAELMDATLRSSGEERIFEEIRHKVTEFTNKFPLDY